MKRRVILINIVVLILCIEIISRVFLFMRFDTGVFSVRHLIREGFYRNITEIEPLKENELNILMLGGSVIHKDWGCVACKLKDFLEDSLKRPVRVVNLSYPAHTSRDSYEKYCLLRNKEFDYVIIYHGINDVYLNNIPSDLYRDDYTHAKWYKRMQIVNGHPEKGLYATPLVMHLIYEEILDRTHRVILLPNDGAPEHLIKYGKEVKNKESFMHYISNIIDTAISYNSSVILSEFAFYIPENYRETLFREKKLDYGDHNSSVRVWGYPPYVKNGIISNNQVIWKLALIYNLRMVNADNRIPKSGEYFNDICHLTEKGCEALALLFAQSIIDSEINAY